MKIFLGLIAFIFVTGVIYVGVHLTKSDDPKVIKSYIDSRGKDPIPTSLVREIGKGI